MNINSSNVQGETLDSYAAPLTAAVIIPAKNVGPYIFDCLKSCRSHASITTSIFVIVDGAEDNTKAEIDRFSYAYPSQTIEIIETPGIGAGPARNLALNRHIIEQYVIFVDGDDLISARALGSVCAQMQLFGADMAAPKTHVFDDGGRFVAPFDEGVGMILGERKALVTEARSTPDILDIETSMCMRIFSSSFLRNIQLRFGNERFCEDVAPSRHAFLRANRVLLSSEPFYFYRLNRAGQRTSEVSSTTRDFAQVLEASLHFGLTEIVDDRQGAFFIRRMLRMATWSFRQTPLAEIDSLVEEVVRSLRRVPKGWWKTLIRLDQCTPSLHRKFAAFALTGGSARMLGNLLADRPRDLKYLIQLGKAHRFLRRK